MSYGELRLQSMGPQTAETAAFPFHITTKVKILSFEGFFIPQYTLAVLVARNYQC